MKTEQDQVQVSQSILPIPSTGRGKLSAGTYLLVAGLNYHGAPISIRERIVIPDSCLSHALQALKQLPHVKEAIMLSTCNRTEVYAVVTDIDAGPPKVWMNAASATIYRNSLDREMDEYSGEIGSGFSVDVCQKWEAAFLQYDLPQTRKIILRTGIVLGKQGGPLTPLALLTRLGLGGKQGGGNQYFSWLHASDFCRIVEFLNDHSEAKGAYNVTSPVPIRNAEFMTELRGSLHVPFGLPMSQWFLEIGAWLMRTETELILKSRRVIPRRLEEAGYVFQFRNIREALEDLVNGSMNKNAFCSISFLNPLKM